MYQGLSETNFKFPGQSGFYRGKVRDVYRFGSYLALIATDRISAFDVILPRPIPFKGQVLTQLASKFLKLTSGICPNWLLETPDPNVMFGYACKPYPIEMVIRGYLTGHAWREYRDGKRSLCGVSLPNGLKQHDPFPEPIITPVSKATEGHDEDISKEQILTSGLVPEKEYELLENYTRKLFAFGQEYARQQGLILVDTKYEFGTMEGDIYLIDEVHTPDSSRYFYLDGYEERQEQGEEQRQLSKEFVRQWLIANGFQGLEGQKMPRMDDHQLATVTNRYIELFEQVTGEKFIKLPQENIQGRIENNLLTTLEKYGLE